MPNPVQLPQSEIADEDNDGGQPPWRTSERRLKMSDGCYPCNAQDRERVSPARLALHVGRACRRIGYWRSPFGVRRAPSCQSHCSLQLSSNLAIFCSISASLLERDSLPATFIFCSILFLCGYNRAKLLGQGRDLLFQIFEFSQDSREPLDIQMLVEVVSS